MANYFTLLTPTGLAKITNAQLTESKIELARIAIGDSNGINYKPVGTETKLKNEKWRGAIASASVDPNNPNWIVVEAVVPASVGGFTLREVALYDVVGDIIAIGNYPDTYKPVVSDGSTMDLVLRTIIEVGNASTVSLKVDPNIIIASRKYVDDKVAKITYPVTGVNGKTGAVKIAASDVGAVSSQDFNAHSTDKTNPHGVTAAQVGAASAQDFTTHSAESASTTKKGHVQLIDAIDSTSTVLAATANAAKKAYDRAVAVNSKQVNSIVGLPPTALSQDYPEGITFFNILNSADNHALWLATINSFLGTSYTTTNVYFYVTTTRSNVYSRGGTQKVEVKSNRAEDAGKILHVLVRGHGPASGLNWSTWKRILDHEDYDKLFQFANDGKTKVATAVTAKGVTASPSDTFATLATKIGQIETGKKWAEGTLTIPTTGENLIIRVPTAFKPETIVMAMSGDYGQARIVVNGNVRTVTRSGFKDSIEIITIGANYFEIKATMTAYSGAQTGVSAYWKAVEG